MESHIESVVVNDRSFELVFKKEDGSVTVDLLGYEELGLKGVLKPSKSIQVATEDYKKLIAFYDDLEILEPKTSAFLKGAAFLTGVALTSVLLN